MTWIVVWSDTLSVEGGGGLTARLVDGYLTLFKAVQSGHPSFFFFATLWLSHPLLLPSHPLCRLSYPSVFCPFIPFIATLLPSHPLCRLSYPSLFCPFVPFFATLLLSHPFCLLFLPLHHLVRPQSLNVLPLKPGVDQYIAIHATLTARDFFLAYFYSSSPFTCIFFQNLSRFFPVLAVANTWFLCRPAE